MIERIDWHDSFNVGVKIVDIQHQKLFSLINELIVQTSSEQQKGIIEKVLDDLMDYTDYHFKTEEKLFKVHPGFKKHKVVHQSFIEKVSGFVSVFKAGNKDFKPAIVGFLVDWIKKHVLDMDKAYFQELGYSFNEEVTESKDIQTRPLICEKVLVVDDSPEQRFLLKTVLEQECYKVVEAESGVGALAVCQENSDIRIVITDINMPGMDGFELISTLRKQQVRYVYIIVVTAQDDKETVIKALSSGADDFLSKPVFPHELSLRIQAGQQLLKLESQDELIFSLAKLSDYRSLETGRHLERVRQYTLEIARYLVRHYPEKGIKNQMADEISRVSPLHDIGKVAISDRILKKPGRLTNEEFDIMKEHSRIGGDLISDIYLKTGSPSLRIAFELTMYHHEKWDGTGYPAGLSGNGIPVAARVMAMADVYDALTTERVYKKAFSHEKARQIIVEGKGKHFDPDLVDIFLALEKRFVKFKKELNDK
ncbi:MAG: bacteriohemerythrin [Deltaproteobacteria bacterium]|nr:bacteriohemerythrin [Deltaproteobacteria bacterium]